MCPLSFLCSCGMQNTNSFVRMSTLAIAIPMTGLQTIAKLCSVQDDNQTITMIVLGPLPMSIHVHDT